MGWGGLGMSDLVHNNIEWWHLVNMVMPSVSIKFGEFLD
jgi:hypothetical protein